MKTAEGELLQHVLQLEGIVKAKKEKDNEQVFADIMGDGDKEQAHKNYEQARAKNRGEGDKMSKYGMSKAPKKPAEMMPWNKKGIEDGDPEYPITRGEGDKMGKGGMCKGAMCKKNCMDEGCGSGLKKGGLYMGDMGEKNKYCQEKFGKNYSECSPSQKAQCDKHCGDMKKGNYMMSEELENPKLADRDKDGKLSSWEKTVGKKIEQSKKGKQTGDYKSDRGNKKIQFKEEKKQKVTKEDFTSRFIAQKTGADLVKYEQESISDNGVPQFVDHYGIRAVNYQTNGRIPHYEQNAQSINAISEKAKMPAFAKTGYDVNGSSLHMHLTNGGDRADGNWNIAPIEERLTELKKGATNPGLVDEIANLMESIANRL